MHWIEIVRRCFDVGSVVYTRHARLEMKGEGFGHILEKEVYETVSGGEVVEEYLGDAPYPSVLILGRTQKNRPLHVVCAYAQDEDLLIIVTVYHPDPALWVDYRRRRR
ncbi:MAG: DUF4258 domain-containing protein [Dehalococcoidia bacterium]